MRIIFNSALLFTVAFLYTGCETKDTFAQPPPKVLQGEWVSQPDEVRLEFLPNNRFALTIPGENPERVTGWAYYPQANHVSLKFDARVKMCPGVTGVYLYSKDGGVLTFTVVQDECEERIGIFGRSWRAYDSGWF